MEGLSIFPLGNSSQNGSNPLMGGLENLQGSGKGKADSSFLSIYSENSKTLEGFVSSDLEIESLDVSNISPNELEVAFTEILNSFEDVLKSENVELSFEDLEKLEADIEALGELLISFEENIELLPKEQNEQIIGIVGDVNTLLNQIVESYQLPIVFDGTNDNNPNISYSDEVKGVDLESLKKAASQWDKLLSSPEFKEFKAIENVRSDGGQNLEPIEVFLKAPLEKQKLFLKDYPELKAVLMPLMKETIEGQVGVEKVNLEKLKDVFKVVENSKGGDQFSPLNKGVSEVNSKKATDVGSSSFIPKEVAVGGTRITRFEQPESPQLHLVESKALIENVNEKTMVLLEKLPLLKEVIKQVVIEKNTPSIQGDMTLDPSDTNKNELTGKMFEKPSLKDEGESFSGKQKNQWFKEEEKLLGKALPEIEVKPEKNTSSTNENKDYTSIFGEDQNNKLNLDTMIKPSGQGVVEVIRKDFNGQTLSVESVPSYRTTPLEQFTAVSQVTKQVDWMLGEGQSEMSFRLRPEHLGEVAVSIGLKDNVMKLSVEVESMQAMEALHEGMEEMRKSVESLLHKVEKVDVSLLVDPKLSTRPDPREDRRRMKDQRQEQNSKSDDSQSNKIEDDKNRHKIRLLGYNTQEYIV